MGLIMFASADRATWQTLTQKLGYDLQFRGFRHLRDSSCDSGVHSIRSL